MDEPTLRALLARVAASELTLDDALEALRALPFETRAGEGLTLDHHRALRLGFPEAVYGAGKTPSQIAAALKAIAARGVPGLATRVTPEAAEAIVAKLPAARWDALSRTVALGEPGPAIDAGPVAVVSAGTSDRPVAEEAAITLALHGARVERVEDVGVAGLHRLLARRRTLESAAALIVVAGMEGALPSVVGGLVGAPLVAVPTSVGYGASLGGVAALLGMLGSCAPGISVVNVDNGYGAACAVLRILRSPQRLSSGG